MARIFYGISGEGGGHAGRAKAIVPYLLSCGHDVKIVSYGRGFLSLKDVFEVEEITGLSLAYNEKNEIENAKTLLDNVLKTPKLKKSFDVVSHLMEAFQPDFVLSDFEFITSMVASLKKIPLLSLDNQHALTKTKIEYPKKYELDATKVKAVIRLFSLFPVEKYIVTSFFPTEKLNKKVVLIPPIVRQEVLQLVPQKQDFVLVYLTSSPGDAFLEILFQVRKNFVVYGTSLGGTQKNVTFQNNPQHFLSDLQNCEGIIANAGFSLLSEALFLKKPYLAVPVKGQFEQTVNALYLEKLGYGKHWDDLTQEKIEAFLFNLSLYEERLQHYPYQNNAVLFQVLDQFIEEILQKK